LGVRFEVSADESILPKDSGCRTAWSKGAAARRMNVPKNQNPYKGTGIMEKYHEAWNDGWEKAGDKNLVHVKIHHGD